MQDYNRAFKEALSSTRLELVLDLCNRVKPSDLFRSPNLEQQVILSLIQQLGRNLLERTKLKCDYLQHLVKRIDELNCDPTDQFAYRTVRRVRMLATGFINEHLV
uniref:DRIM domain-containing protein n=1 Tax=Macrostomum lignano TaxID=282301 RepID=A0A1I8IU36_9PLAT